LPIRLLNRTVYGLLDSGAAISCVGGQLACEVLDKYDYKTITANAATADGRSQPIVGRLKLDVEYNNVKNPLTIYIIPSLKQDLYLGIDFWRLFDLLPKCLNISELESVTESNGKVETDQHDLSEAERAKLINVISCFPSFTQEGLGKTNLIEHSIDVGMAKPIKQRHFPVSPAVEKAMYAEIDRMIQLGVIEESESAWSSPIVPLWIIRFWRSD